jgi:hypothetical protein
LIPLELNKKDGESDEKDGIFQLTPTESFQNSREFDVLIELPESRRNNKMTLKGFSIHLL